MTVMRLLNAVRSGGVQGEEEGRKRGRCVWKRGRGVYGLEGEGF